MLLYTPPPSTNTPAIWKGLFFYTTDTRPKRLIVARLHGPANPTLVAIFKKPVQTVLPTLTGVFVALVDASLHFVVGINTVKELKRAGKGTVYACRTHSGIAVSIGGTVTLINPTTDKRRVLLHTVKHHGAIALHPDADAATFHLTVTSLAASDPSYVISVSKSAVTATSVTVHQPGANVFVGPEMTLVHQDGNHIVQVDAVTSHEVARSPNCSITELLGLTPNGQAVVLTKNIAQTPRVELIPLIKGNIAPPTLAITPPPWLIRTNTTFPIGPPGRARMRVLFLIRERQRTKSVPLLNALPPIAADWLIHIAQVASYADHYL
jgi:hypothetical protein